LSSFEVGGGVVLFVLHRSVTPFEFMKNASDILAVFLPATPGTLIVPLRIGGTFVLTDSCAVVIDQRWSYVLPVLSRPTRAAIPLTTHNFGPCP